MNYKELSEILQAQNEVLTKTLKSQNKIIESLTSEVSELKSIILQKDGKAEKLVNQLNGLTKIAFPKKTERVNYVDKTLSPSTPSPTPKERGNNGAKRKVYDNLVEIVEEVEPSHPEFTSHKDKARLVSSNDVIRYKFIPPKLVKHI